MKKIRIPRKKKKQRYWRGMPYIAYKCFPNAPKIVKYYNYFDIERGIKRFGMSAEELYNTFGGVLKDYVIWWHWVRYKHLNIEPNMSDEFKEYWDYFVNQGVIKIK